ncbi:hypothetical protein OsI_15500 [Oryza sativa Indica Group]|uniref:Uncharacterized protein n=1 Tax=Oryza sativa subsp. indica TaxID=39946 RepID=B8ASR3_ORYSI|nr:hypothetical protein OsI_15500 [Oryza sativa Indica Group]
MTTNTPRGSGRSGEPGGRQIRDDWRGQPERRTGCGGALPAVVGGSTGPLEWRSRKPGVAVAALQCRREGAPVWAPTAEHQVSGRRGGADQIDDDRGRWSQQGDDPR